MTGMLASVRNLKEANIVYRGGADIIDLKEPNQGALGAVPLNIIHNVVDELWEKSVISATVGDLPADSTMINAKVMQTAETGVDYVKVGMFSERHIQNCLPKLIECTHKGIAIIAVFFADMDFNIDNAIKSSLKAKLKGVMLDTALKNNGHLLTHKNLMQLEYFVNRAKQNNLLTGLAGSLKLDDISTTLKARPDYIGFRTALCDNEERIGDLSIQAIEQVRNCIPFPESPAVSLA